MSATQELLRFGIFELNLATQELRKSGTPIKLPPLPFKLLALLARHAGQIVTRQEIQEQLWGAETFVDFEQSVNKCIKQIRKALNDNADSPLYIETLPRHGYRFLAPVVSKTIAAPGPRVVKSQSGELPSLRVLIGRGATVPARAGALAPNYPEPVTDAEAKVVPVSQATDIRESRSRLWRNPFVWVGVAVMVVALIGGGLYWRAHKAPMLTEKDTIVLADFDNKTGDPVFDDTLKQGLTIQLQQSPFLNVLSDRKVAGTLKRMNRPPDEPLTEDVTHEVCLRTNSKAMITGSIAALGSRYVIGLKAVACNTEDLLAETQVQAADKDQVLKAMDGAAVDLRRKLGESISSVQKYATPLEAATTPSLEALKVYSLGFRTSLSKGETASLPFYERAVEFDPNFAMAYANLAILYSNLNQVGRAAENARRAYELREKVTERERLVIESTYYTFVTGELEKAAEVYELWQQIYSRDYTPYGNLAFIYGDLGSWEKSLEEDRAAMRMEPNDWINYNDLGSAYTSLNWLDQAEAVYKQAQERKLEGEDLLANLYQLAFLKGDTEQMGRLLAAAAGKPGTEDFLLASQADTEAWHGRLKGARELTSRAMASAQHNDAKETAAIYQAAAALREAASGNREQARADANAAVKLASNRDVRSMAALALAQAGDIASAQQLAAELDKTFPLDTLVQKYWLPTIRAAIALQHKDPNLAVDLLKKAAVIELGQTTTLTVFLCPVYLRGEAYLLLHDGPAAAAEFQKFLDHYGLVGNFSWGALARLGLARAYALDAVKGPAARDRARTAYQDFLKLWKNADPDTPIYIQAKAEYAKLQ